MFLSEEKVVQVLFGCLIISSLKVVKLLGASGKS